MVFNTHIQKNCKTVSKPGTKLQQNKKKTFETRTLINEVFPVHSVAHFISVLVI